MFSSNGRTDVLTKFILLSNSVIFLIKGNIGLDHQQTVLWFLGTFFSITAYNIWRVHKDGMLPASFNPTSIVPTYAAFIRTLICILLIIPLASEYYHPFLSLAYLTYYAIISLTYNTTTYHKAFARGLRIVGDFAFAFAFTIYYGPVKNPTWLAFLIPIAVLGRYYSIKGSFLLSASGFLIILGFSVFPQSSQFWELTRNAFDATFKGQEILYGKELISFGDYVRKPDILSSWSTLKQLFIIGCIFLFVPLLYYDETHIRMGSIFNFGRYLDNVFISNSKQITSKLLEFICYYVNSEAVIAVNDDLSQSQIKSINRSKSIPAKTRRKIIAVFQTHGNQFVSHQYDLASEMETDYETMVIKNLEETRESNLPKICNETISSFKKNVTNRKETTTIESYRWHRLNIKKIDVKNQGFWEFVSYKSDKAIDSIEEFFFKSALPLKTLRKRAAMYKNFEIVTIVVIQIKDWKLYFINNFSHGYRVVPRSFWSDGLEKIYFIKSKME